MLLNENTSFDEWAELWSKYKCIGLSRDYKIAIQSQVGYLKNYLGNMSVTTIRPLDVDYVIGEIANCNPYTKKPSSQKTLRDLRNTARNIFDFVADNTDNYNKNPASKTKLPKTAPRETRRALTSKEIEWVIKTEHRGRIAAIIMVFCGLRAGELISLEWCDINFDNSSMYIGRSVKKTDNNAYEIKYATKNGKTRTIPVPPKVMEELTKEKKHSQSSFICSQIDGSMHTPSSWRKLWESYNNTLSHYYASNAQAEKSIYAPSGIKKKVSRITPHYFRHTYATMLYTSGVDPLTAQKLLGHSHISTTLAIYTHLENEKIAVSIEKYDVYVTKYWK